jgi:hypothetical protein
VIGMGRIRWDCDLRGVEAGGTRSGTWSLGPKWKSRERCIDGFGRGWVGSWVFGLSDSEERGGEGRRVQGPKTFGSSCLRARFSRKVSASRYAGGTKALQISSVQILGLRALYESAKEKKKKERERERDLEAL